MTETTHAAVAVARRAIFDQQRRLWGYELFCVGNTAESPTGIPVAGDVPVTVAASTGMGLQQIVARQKRIMVSLSEKNILDDQVYALPPSSTTVLVSEETYLRPGIAARLARLKADDFPVAVPCFTNRSECADLYRLADTIGIVVEGLSHDELAAALAAIDSFGAQPMACEVADAGQFNTCRDLGFRLFQGAFSKEPEIVRLRRVSSGQIARFNLLKLVGTDEPDFRRLSIEIQSDATISFRLLTYLNSASFAFSSRVNSISHAVNLLGWRRIRSWLRVVLLSDLNQDPGQADLLRVAAQRAKFLEVVTDLYSFWGFAPESMHLLGLFSLLDTMVGIPMPEIVSFLPLDAPLKAALCGEADSEYLPLLQLVRDLEEARWPEVEAATQRLNLDSVGVRVAFQEAVTWAGELDAMMGDA